MQKKVNESAIFGGKVVPVLFRYTFLLLFCTKGIGKFKQESYQKFNGSFIVSWLVSTLFQNIKKA